MNFLLFGGGLWRWGLFKKHLPTLGGLDKPGLYIFLATIFLELSYWGAYGGLKLLKTKKKSFPGDCPHLGGKKPWLFSFRDRGKSPWFFRYFWGHFFLKKNLIKKGAGGGFFFLGFLIRARLLLRTTFFGGFILNPFFLGFKKGFFYAWSCCFFSFRPPNLFGGHLAAFSRPILNPGGLMFFSKLFKDNTTPQQRDKGNKIFFRFFPLFFLFCKTRSPFPKGWNSFLGISGEKFSRGAKRGGF